jgi:hypothetical protein
VIRFALLLLLAASLAAAPASAADVLIQAGHEGRPDCEREPASLCNNTGAAAPPGEITWTPIVANEAARILTAAGVSVNRAPAYLPGVQRARLAVFLHFDGAEAACSTGASVGYPPGSQRAAAAWKALYQTYFPFAFQPDNFTDHLAHYYGFHHVDASDGKVLIEFGEMSCPAQHVWLAKRLQFLGALVAYYVSRQLGEGNVALPRAIP